jgi:fluoride ion exporter CrcB/FEX
MKTPQQLPVEVLFVILAAIGGISRYLSNYVNGERFRLSMLIANLFVSGFAGLMFALFARSFGLSIELQWISSGVGGFMGTEAVKFIVQKIKRQFP